MAEGISWLRSGGIEVHKLFEGDTAGTSSLKCRRCWLAICVREQAKAHFPIATQFEENPPGSIFSGSWQSFHLEIYERVEQP
jgi:hypothetical protein